MTKEWSTFYHNSCKPEIVLFRMTINLNRTNNRTPIARHRFAKHELSRVRHVRKINRTKLLRFFFFFGDTSCGTRKNFVVRIIATIYLHVSKMRRRISPSRGLFTSLFKTIVLVLGIGKKRMRLDRKDTS